MMDTRFPILFAASTVGHRVFLTKAIENLLAGVDNGQIANIVFKNARSDINDAIDRAWTAHVLRPFVYTGQLTDIERELDRNLSVYPMLHTVGAFNKRIAKSGLDTDYTRAMLALLNEIAPLAEAAENLKDKVVKRQPKADPREAYNAPAASQTAIVHVKAVLEAVTEEARDALDAAIRDQLEATLSDFLPLRVRFKNTDIFQARSLVNSDDYIAYERMREIERSAGSWLWSCIDHHNLVRRPEAADVIAKTAKKNADTLRENFVYKNLKKIDSIIEKKGDFDKIERIGYDLSLAGLEGSFRVTFKDGSHFSMTNSVVFVVNQYGTAFNRFPLRFHDVVGADGKVMKSPSERKMNEEFAR